MLHFWVKKLPDRRHQWITEGTGTYWAQPREKQKKVQNKITRVNAKNFKKNYLSTIAQVYDLPALVIVCGWLFQKLVLTKWVKRETFTN